jgi:hypothetical protein
LKFAGICCMAQVNVPPSRSFSRGIGLMLLAVADGGAAAGGGVLVLPPQPAIRNADATPRATDRS